ncbi:MAG: Na+/H+ antiporter NhaA [Ilumatobacteraceae bacterium]
MNHSPNLSDSSSVRPLSPLRDFLRKESAGATLLCAGAVIALIWANSPWSSSYEDLWSTRVVMSFGEFTMDLDLRHWVNDGLMAIFFLVVGLEIKREVTDGHLASRRAALLPVVAAIGGMVVPALIYLVVAGDVAARGWAIPVATDIALAVGVLSVAGRRVPSPLRAFLLGLAIVDDIGAIIIIAVVYSSGVTFGWMIAAVIGVVLTLIVRRVGVQSVPAYVVVGVVVWLGLYKGGVHPTLAGVVMGLIAPVTPRRGHDYVDVEERPDLADSLRESTVSSESRDTVSVVEWLLHVLHPWTSFVIVPIFALANSGLEVSTEGFRNAAGSAVTWGVFLGLVVGKPLGIFVSTRVAIRSGLADKPAGVTTRHVLGAGSAAGIGFTVALFITELALDEGIDQANAKLAILLASVVSALLSIFFLMGSSAKGSDANEA